MYFIEEPTHSEKRRLLCVGSIAASSQSRCVGNDYDKRERADDTGHDATTERGPFEQCSHLLSSMKYTITSLLIVRTEQIITPFLKYCQMLGYSSI